MKLLLTLALFVLLVAGCTNALPPADWCFEFDFRNSNYGFIVHDGQWLAGNGFATGATGFLKLTYVNDAVVAPNAAIFTVARGSSVAVPTEVRVEADIFGMTSGVIRTNVPASVNTTDIRMAGEGGTSYLVIDGKASAPVRLIRMQVRGLGSNPFSASSCSTDAVEAIDVNVDTEIPSEIGAALAEADSALAGVDVDLTAPDGSPLLPALTAAAAIFGYLKWILSGTAADELAGPFAPMVSHMGIYVAVNFALTGIYMIVYGAIYAVRWAIWLFKTIMEIVQTIAGLLASIPGVIIIGVLLLIVALLAVIGGVLTNFFGG